MHRYPGVLPLLHVMGKGEMTKGPKASKSFGTLTDVSTGRTYKTGSIIRKRCSTTLQHLPLTQGGRSGTQSHGISSSMRF
jgi:hypothetical protein